MGGVVPPTLIVLPSCVLLMASVCLASPRVIREGGRGGGREGGREGGKEGGREGLRRMRVECFSLEAHTRRNVFVCLRERERGKKRKRGCESENGDTGMTI